MTVGFGINGFYVLTVFRLCRFVTNGAPYSRGKHARDRLASLHFAYHYLLRDLVLSL